MPSVLAHCYNFLPCFQTELEALEKRQSQYSQMESHSSKLLKEVKTAQESLANYNTVLDKVGEGRGEERVFFLLTREFVMEKPGTLNQV